jgi:hypothetical protein
MFGGFCRDRLADLCRALGLDGGGGVQEKERARLREIIERVNSCSRATSRIRTSSPT